MIVHQEIDHEAEAQLACWEAAIKHLDCRADILLLHLEDRYYSLLRVLREKECNVRAALCAVAASTYSTRTQAEAKLASAMAELQSALSEASLELG